jgi:hypothetical protein
MLECFETREAIQKAVPECLQMAGTEFSNSQKAGINEYKVVIMCKNKGL